MDGPLGQVITAISPPHGYFTYILCDLWAETVRLNNIGGKVFVIVNLITDSIWMDFLVPYLYLQTNISPDLSINHKSKSNRVPISRYAELVVKWKGTRLLNRGNVGHRKAWHLRITLDRSQIILLVLFVGILICRFTMTNQS